MMSAESPCAASIAFGQLVDRMLEDHGPFAADEAELICKVWEAIDLERPTVAALKATLEAFFAAHDV